MTEAEWLECTHHCEMLWYLKGKVSDRKLRLAACAYCRSVWQFLGKASRKAVLLGEKMADEQVAESRRQAVLRAAIEAVCRFEEASGDFFFAADMAYRVVCNDGWYAANWTMGNWTDLASGVPILVDIFGNPFRPVSLNPTWLTSTVVALARTIYSDRAYDHLPILAGALVEAGCDNEDILGHCRQPGLHVRGCWMLDLILGKE